MGQEHYVRAKAAKFRLWFNKHNARLRACPTLFVNERERGRKGRGEGGERERERGRVMILFTYNFTNL